MTVTPALRDAAARLVYLLPALGRVECGICRRVGRPGNREWYRYPDIESAVAHVLARHRRDALHLCSHSKRS